MRAFTLALVLAFPTMTWADYLDGNDLSQLARSERQVDEAMFRGYVAGVQDAYQGKYFCVHEDVRMSQAAAVVAKYLEQKPDEWHLAGKQLVINALADAFPCG